MTQRRCSARRVGAALAVIPAACVLRDLAAEPRREDDAGRLRVRLAAAEAQLRAVMTECGARARRIAQLEQHLEGAGDGGARAQTAGPTQTARAPAAADPQPQQRQQVPEGAAAPDTAPQQTPAPPQLPRCATPPALPERLRRSPRRLWFSGCSAAAVGGSRAGLNNQRQTLMAAAVLADAADAALVIGPYGSNAHDPNASLTWSDFYDLDHLSAVLQRGAAALEAVGSCVPGGIPRVTFSALWLGPQATLDLGAFADSVRALGADVELYVHHEACSGHPLARFGGSSAAALHRADSFLQQAFRFPAAITQLGEQMLAAARPAAVRRRGTSGRRRPRVHCAHLRVKYAADHIEFPFGPLVNCTQLWQEEWEQHSCQKPQRLTCMCVDPTRKLGALGALHARTPTALKPLRPQYLDFDWVLMRHHSSGSIRAGDAVLIATNNASEPRVAFTAEAAALVGVRAVVASELANVNTSFGRQLLWSRPPVLQPRESSSPAASPACLRW
eukprot:TRINITY_DN18935_c0_g1_i2.p1 TRINITY_DN18935_c0_g1~~TRINITY_DN18935_c0_g1_i2.p1  ORF type:complete len:503 (+),score=94.45 TRINITY_DN18935_c0_g1_i2:119-1627(+)